MNFGRLLIGALILFFAQIFEVYTKDIDQTASIIKGPKIANTSTVSACPTGTARTKGSKICRKVRESG